MKKDIEDYLMFLFIGVFFLYGLFNFAMDYIIWRFPV